LHLLGRHSTTSAMTTVSPPPAPCIENSVIYLLSAMTAMVKCQEFIWAVYIYFFPLIYLCNPVPIP
jgi:hypothetical protein